MNALGIALVWCAVQVTLVALVTGGLYFLLRRIWPTAGSAVALTSLLVVIGLTGMAVSPWPRWSLSRAAPPVAEQLASRSPSDSQGATSQGAREPVGAKTVEQPVAPARPTVSTLLWQAMLDELAPVRAETASPAWRWPAILAVVVLLGIAGQVVWFVFGAVALRRYRVESRAVEDGQLWELLAVLRTELGCPRPIELRESSELATAATIGWRRPVVLMPADWREWNPAQRRAVLAHEIAHVRSNDFLAVLAGQLSVALHFYHPLVHWLLGRLRLEQELVADALAAGISGGQRSYLAAIAELALREQGRPLPWPARSFLPTRNTFLRRIAMLRDSKLRFGRLSPMVRGLVVGMVLLCGVAVVGLRSPHGEPQAAQPASQPAAADAGSQIDWKYIPKAAKALWAVRGAAIFRHPEFTQLAAMLNAPDGAVLGEFGIPVEKVAQMTMVALRIPGPETPFALMMPGGVFIVQATEPNDFARCIQKQLGTSVQKSYQGRVYLVSKSDDTRPAAFRPDDRTVIIGRESDLRAFLASPGGAIPTILAQNEVGKRLQTYEVLAAADGGILKDYANDVMHRVHSSAASALASFAPLWEKTNTAALGIAFKNRIEIELTAFADGKENAGSIEETLQALRNLAQNALDSPAPARGRNAQPDAVRARQQAQEFLKQLTLERTEGFVRVTSSAGLDAMQLATDAFIAQRRANQMIVSSQNLRQIGLSMHNYLDRHACFPPAVLYGPDGKTPYSWRVALLPFMGEAERRLYEQYHFDQLWDSPENRKVLEQMPAVYRSPQGPRGPGLYDAAYYVLTGPGTIFDGKEGTRLESITDGPAWTILVVEAQRDIPWTKPEDIPYDPKKPLPKLGGFHPSGYAVGIADGSARWLFKGMPESQWRALISKSGGERVEMP